MAEKDVSKIWPVLSIITGSAMNVTLSKYGSSLPNWAVLLIWTIALLFFISWVVLEERSKAFVRHFKETPASYCAMLIVFVVSLTFATHIVIAKVYAHSAAVATTSNPEPPKINPDPKPSTAGPTTQPHMPMVTQTHHPKQRGTKQDLASQSLQAPIPAPGSVSVSGDVDMSGDGCQQKIISGSNNTNVCGVPPPPLLKLSVSELTPPGVQGSLVITISVNTDWAPVSLQFNCDGIVESISPEGGFDDLKRFVGTQVAKLSFRSPALSPDEPLRVHLQGAITSCSVERAGK